MKKAKQATKIESVERDDNGTLKCPICGKIIITEEEGTSSGLCKHVLFVYLDAVQEFEFVQKGFKKTADKISRVLDDGEGLGWDDVLKAKILPKWTRLLDLTETGLCCGPCSFTITIGVAE